MPKKEISYETKLKIDNFLNSLYLDVQGAGTINNKLSEEYVLKLLTRFLVSLGTAFWSITELLDYIRTRREFREFKAQ